MILKNNKVYLEDVVKISNLELPWDVLKDQTFLISGASGMIGSFLIDVLMYRNYKFQMNCHIIALGRNLEKAKARFGDYWENDNFEFISHDLNLELENIGYGDVDLILHAASNTHPLAYATDPIGTITTNIIGTNHLLNFACCHHCKRFVFTSSVEVYGENRGDIDAFKEEYCGYIDCNTLRAGYPESKRCGEALCQAYRKARGLDIVIPRLARTYGPTMLMTDTKAISQFIQRAIDGKDIVLKSAGTQLYSYTYVADAVGGILTVLFQGISGNAYNISDKDSDIRLKKLAEIIADISGVKLIYECPDQIEQTGYSTATKAIMNASKLRDLNWKPCYKIKEGLQRTYDILTK